MDIKVEKFSADTGFTEHFITFKSRKDSFSSFKHVKVD